MAPLFHVGSVVVLAALAAPASSTPASLPAVKVTMNNHLTFDPHLVTVEIGDSVLFVNDSDLVHSVTAHPDHATLEDSYRLPEGAEPFHSGFLDPGDEFEHRFDVPGVYKYFCVRHESAPAAEGWVRVVPAPDGGLLSP